MRPLSQLLHSVESLRRAGPDVLIDGVEYDSRRVKPNGAFVAMTGAATDGNRYVEQAIARGASFIVTDTPSVFDLLVSAHPGTAVLQVAHGRRALAELARAFYGFPDENLGLTGVTGTNGKTTTAYLLEQMLRTQQRKTVLVGTIEYRIGERVMPSPHTTPEASDLLALFAEGLQEGATEAVMEVSSHALDQGRVWKLAFDVAIFTNLTRDHLDYHRTMDEYLRTKQRLFDGSCSQPPKTAIINADDAAASSLMAAARRGGAQTFTYGIAAGDFRATDIQMSAAGMHFRLHSPFGALALHSRLVGRMNVYNVLAAAAAAVARGVVLADVVHAADALTAPPGRFQTIGAGQDFSVIVDYAHTDDALRNVTRLAREIAGSGRVITVFGCGGDRDTTKRPLMGRAAGEGSDIVIVTSDNPRSESPIAIIEQILPGLKETPAIVLIEPERAQAIALAIQQARAGDLVLIAGKGHEKTQTIGAQVLSFDDAAVAQASLVALLKRGAA